MALKVNSDIALTGSLTVSGSYGLAAADIPSLAASKITSGTFAAARIPSLAASKITSGTFADARIASAANWNTAYNWGNHASAGYSSSDTNYYLNGISKSGNTLTFSVNGATNQSYTFGSNAFNSTSYLPLSGGTVTGDVTFNDDVFGIYHGFIEDKYYFDSYSGNRNIMTIPKSMRADIIRYRGFADFEYWNGSSWVATTSQDGNIRNLLDGRQDTGWNVPTTYKKFRFSVYPSTSWPTGALIGLQTSWTGASYPGCQMIVEENVNGTWTTRHTSDFTSSNGNSNWGTHFRWDSALHTGYGAGGYNTRITVDFSNFATSGGYTTIPMQNIFIFSNFSGTENTDYSNLLDYYRHIVAPNKLYITTTDTNTSSTTALVLNGTEVEKRTLGSLAFSSATYDNYGSWNLKTGGTQRTTVGSGGTLDIVGGTNVSVAYSAGGVVTISSTDTNTTYSVGDGGLTQKNFTTTLKNKLDGIATSADAYGGWNISDGTNSEKIQANNTLTVQGGGSASVSYDSGNNTLTVNATDTNTTYSTATSSTLGLVKIGYAENGKNYPVELSSGKMFVNVPWTDTNTDTDTITRVGTAGNQISGDITIAASGAASVSQSGGTITISATNTTYSEYNGGSAGLVPGGSGGTGKFLQEDGQWAIPQDTNTTYSAGAGLDLSGTTFSVEGNLSGDVYAIGRDGNDKYVVNTTNHAWYLDGVLDMRLNNNGNLDVDGDVIAYSTVTSSDRKLKTNIQTLENASEKVKALRGVSFTWDHGKKAGKEDIGLIAQEVEEVVPEIVGEAELLDGTMAKHVDYPKLVALLIESNKELMARVETLEAKLNGITE